MEYITRPPFSWNLGLTRDIPLPPDFEVKKATVLSPEFELDNPPNYFEMFRQFKIKFFNNQIPGYTIRISSGMVSYFGRIDFPQNQIVISKKMLRDQPRSVTVRTMLYVMVQAYLDKQGVPRKKILNLDEEFETEVQRIKDNFGIDVDSWDALNCENLEKILPTRIPDSFRAQWGRKTPKRKRRRRY